MLISVCVATIISVANKPFKTAHFENVLLSTPCEVGPCHHGMARPQVADAGTASDMEGS